MQGKTFMPAVILAKLKAKIKCGCVHFHFFFSLCSLVRLFVIELRGQRVTGATVKRNPVSSVSKAAAFRLLFYIPASLQCVQLCYNFASFL
jgi:hypothetical protein